jgi:hypothetical protein
MTLTRIFTFAIPEAADQDYAVSTFNGFKANCKKVCSLYCLLMLHYLTLRILWKNKFWIITNESGFQKNDAPYIVAVHAAKVKVLKDTTNSANWTVYASITFNNEE